MVFHTSDSLNGDVDQKKANFIQLFSKSQIGHTIRVVLVIVLINLRKYQPFHSIAKFLPAIVMLTRL